jgi:hypothetical protein
VGPSLLPWLFRGVHCRDGWSVLLTRDEYQQFFAGVRVTASTCGRRSQTYIGVCYIKSRGGRHRSSLATYDPASDRMKICYHSLVDVMAWERY